MTHPQTVRFYLEPDLCKSAQAGRHNFIAKVAHVLTSSGFAADYADTALRGADGFDGYSLTHMKPAPNQKGLTFRRVYHYPFWQIDQSHERWHWRVAKATFHPDQIDPKQANSFYTRWQKRLFQDAPVQAIRDGFIYVPLQGRLLEKRSFQRCSPLDMLRQCLRHDRTRRVVAALHPSETYSAAEYRALAELETEYDRLTLQTGGMDSALSGCDYVVSMNSGAAFAAYLFAKPVMLFADIDFHHIAIRADLSCLEAAFAKISQHQPDYARYLWWFWQEQSINAGRAQAEGQIAERLGFWGWPVPNE